MEAQNKAIGAALLTLLTLVKFCLCCWLDVTLFYILPAEETESSESGKLSETNEVVKHLSRTRLVS